MQISVRSFYFGAEDTDDAIYVKIPEVGMTVGGSAVSQCISEHRL